MYTCPGEEPAVDYFVGPAQSMWFDPETIHLITQKSNFFLISTGVEHSIKCTFTWWLLCCLLKFPISVSICGQINRWFDSWLDSWSVCWLDSWSDSWSANWSGSWSDSWLDNWSDSWLDSWLDRLFNREYLQRTCSCLARLANSAAKDPPRWLTSAKLKRGNVWAAHRSLAWKGLEI